MALLTTFSATASLGSGSDDSGILPGDVIMGDTTPFTPVQTPQLPAAPGQQAEPAGNTITGDTTPFAQTPWPSSAKPLDYSSSPPPFSSDPGLPARAAGTFFTKH